MIVKVERRGCVNYYEGDHVGFHSHIKVPTADGNELDIFRVIVEGRKNCIEIELEYNEDVRIFLMNDQGKTIDSVYI